VTVLGISCYYHDSSAVIIRDGEVVAAAQEERFDRERYSPVFPIQAINFCLQQAGITIYDVDEVAFYEKMYLKFQRTILSHLIGYPSTFRNFVDTMPLWLKDRLAVSFAIEDELSFKKRVRYIKHHLSHASSAFLVSPFERAAILTIDGVGEYACATWGTGADTLIDVQKELHYPHSVGLLYSIFTAFLGFRVFTGEGKVMALAEYGEPEYLDQMRQVVDLKPDGSFRLDPRYFSFNRGEKMHSPAFEDLFGPARQPGEPLTDRHHALAASLQRMTEDIVLAMARHVHAQTGERYLCMAGGVCLNVTANSRIREETPFEDIFIQPAAGDAGAALGAAAYVHHVVQGNPRKQPMTSCALGPSFKNRAVEILLKNARLPYRKLERQELVTAAAQRIAQDQVVGWFQGRAEFGPRALGNRSILANPASPTIKDHINKVIKGRESFRPFGASVQQERVGEYFEFEGESPYMLLVAKVRAERLGAIPAVTHVNDTSRIQTVNREHDPLYWELIEAFRTQTGLPMVLNTSFNRDEPIVNSPAEALACFTGSGMDCLVINDFLVDRPQTGDPAHA
jgi:carbamoyltransferase